MNVQRLVLCFCSSTSHASQLTTDPPPEASPILGSGGRTLLGLQTDMFSPSKGLLLTTLYCMELNNHVSKSYSSCLATLNCTMCWQGLIPLAKYNYRYQCFQILHGRDPTQLKIVTKADSKPVTDSLKGTKSQAKS